MIGDMSGQDDSSHFIPELEKRQTEGEQESACGQRPVKMLLECLSVVRGAPKKHHTARAEVKKRERARETLHVCVSSREGGSTERNKE